MRGPAGWRSRTHPQSSPGQRVGVVSAVRMPVLVLSMGSLRGAGGSLFCSWLGGGRAQPLDLRAASYSDPASVAQLEGTQVRLWD